MTPKEKAKDLVEKFIKVECLQDFEGMDLKLAKECALICVQEMLDFMIISLKWDDKTNGNIHFWQEVLDEVDGL